MIEHGPVVTAGPVAEGAGQPGFPRAGRAGEQQVLMPLDPLATGQALEQGPIEAAGGVMIDVLGGGLLAQAGEPQPGRQALGRGSESASFGLHERTKSAGS